MKKAGKSLSYLLIVTCILLLATCLNPYQGEEATITITVPGSTTARFLPQGTIDLLDHTIRLSRSGSTLHERHNVKENQTESFSVTPGPLDITIHAIHPSDGLIAFGSGTANIISGPNGPIEIKMGPVCYSWGDLENAIVIAPGVQTFLLKPGAGAGVWNADLTINISRDITLLVEDSVEIIRDSSFVGSSADFFTVNSGGNLTLGGSGMTGTLTLDGDKTSFATNNGSLIRVNSGSLIMYNNIFLTNNFAGSGGGVYVSGGTFYMHDGRISNNKAEQSGQGTGGGVYVGGGGTFYMYGGGIEDNEANGAGGGGGVFLGAAGSTANFEMSGGTISGNAASQGSGVALGFSGGTYTFTMSGSARVNGNVWLELAQHQINVEGNLTGTIPVAIIQPATGKYGVGNQVLDGSVGDLINNHTKFDVVPQTTPPQNWIVDSDGKLDHAP